MRALPYCCTFLLSLLFALITSFATLSTAAPTNLRICGFNDWYGGVPWGMVAMSFYGSNFPGTTWDFKILDSGDSLRGIVQQYLANGADCNVLTLVGYSPYALALSPLVSDSVAWVDGGSTSTDLSQKASNPYFNRVIPTDTVGAAGAAVLAASQGWLKASIIVIDDSYGRSVAEGFSTRLQTLGGQVEFSRVIVPTFSVDELKVVLNTVFGSAQSRVFFMAGSFGQPGIDAIRNSSAYGNAFFIFTESMCTDDYLSRVAGAFCATYSFDATAAAALQSAYNSRDIAAEIAKWGPQLDYAAGDTSYQIDFWACMVIDAVRAGMIAAVNYPSVNQTAFPLISDYLHSITFNGLTGFVSFDANGDRVESVLSVFNSQPTTGKGFSLQQVGTIGNGTVRRLDATAPLYYGLGSNGAYALVSPSGLKPPSDSTAAFPYWVIAIIVVAILAIAAAPIARLSRSTTRDNSFAPQNADEPFTIIFTDIQSSTTQWALNPEAMGPSVDQHHDLIRSVLMRNKGYEVKTIGDSFMVAFKNPVDALTVAIEIQQTLHSATWPAEIEDVYQKTGDAIPLTPVAYNEVWAGLRVRVGMHTGKGSIKLDPVTQGYDYYGTVVNTAARVEGVGHGGQVLLTKDAYDAVMNTAAGKAILDTACVSQLGPQPLRGLAEPVQLVQILPAEFAAREFPPLRLDIEKAADEIEDESAHHSSSQHSSMRSTRESAEVILQAAARRGHHGPSYEVLHSQYHLIKTIFATMPLKDRTKCVKEIASRWRIPPTQQRISTSGAAAALDCTLARVIAKAAPAAAAALGNATSHGSATPRQLETPTPR